MRKSSSNSWIGRCVTLSKYDGETDKAAVYRHTAVAVQEWVVVHGTSSGLDFDIALALRMQAILLESA